MNRARHLLSLPILAGLTLSSSAVLTSQTPNTLLIIADDFGIDALGVYGLASNPAPTPNIDSLASSGVRFANAYACPSCSPTRGCILTGRYGFRTGVGSPVPGNSDGMPASETLLPEVLSPTGTATALMGKWHLGADQGPATPTAEGFGVFTGTLGGAVQNYSQWQKVENGSTSQSTAYITTDTVDEALAFIGQQSSTWFLQLSLHAPHTPFHAPPANLHTQDLTGLDPNVDTVAFFKAMVESMDTEIGRLLQTIPPATLANTNILFVGDNGTSGGAVEPPFNPMRSKGSVYENGVHVPLIATGPGVLGSPRVEPALVHVVDLFATIANLHGASAATGTDSRNMVPLLQSAGQPAIRDIVFTEQFSGTTGMTAPGDIEMVRELQFALLRRLRPNGQIRQELYDLINDPLQTTNLLQQPLNQTAQAGFDKLSRELARLRGYPWQATFGSSCSGAGLNPTLEALNEPVLGANFTLRVNGLSTAAIATIGTYGFRRDSWQGILLPLDLTPAGLSNCTLLIDPAVTTLASQAGNTAATWLIDIPAIAGLAGRDLFAQAIPLVPAANPAGALTTNAVEAIVGG